MTKLKYCDDPYEIEYLIDLSSRFIIPLFQIIFKIFPKKKIFFILYRSSHVLFIGSLSFRHNYSICHLLLFALP